MALSSDKARDQKWGSSSWLPFFVLGYMWLSSSAFAQSVTVPITEDGHGRYQTPVMIEGEGPYFFLIDNASRATTAYVSLVRLLGKSADPMRTRRILTATSVVDMPIYTLGEFSWGPIQREIGETVAFNKRSRRNTMGLIGTDMMAGHVLEFDPRKKQLTFSSDTAKFTAENNWHKIPARLTGQRMMAVEVTIGSLTLPALVDTGAETSVLNGPAGLALTPAGSRTEIEVTESQLSAASGQRQRVSRMALDDVRVGGLSLGKAAVAVADLSIFRALGADHAPAMILGMDLLGERPMVLDLKGWNLFLK